MSVGEQPLINDWCQQYPSHSIGSLDFGPDGYLYASGGDGASFNFADWGQHVGNLSPTQTGQANVCGDPANEGGALRSQDLRTTPIRPRSTARSCGWTRDTGAGAPGIPYAGGDANAARIVAEGLRNPFRFTFRPGNERGLDRRRRLERLGGDRSPGDADDVHQLRLALLRGQRTAVRATASLALCQGLYAAGTGAVAAPYYTYSHSAQVVSGETCPTANGSSITGIAFATSATTYPAPYNTALFFADHSRNCIWAMLQGVERSARSLESPHVRGGGVEPGGPADRTRRQPLLRRFRRRHDPADHVDGQPLAGRQGLCIADDAALPR